MQIAPWVFPLTEETASVPRVCGEKIRAVSATTASVESPPRVRGKGFPGQRRRDDFGITPACAGKSAIAGRFTHPSEGSPPRVRGKDVRLCCRSPARRITPACAGKSACAKCRSDSARDHPRVCGEKDHTTDLVQYGAGSPPRVRGKASRCRCDRRGNGITPACAGKSSQPHVFPG